MRHPTRRSLALGFSMAALASCGAPASTVSSAPTEPTAPAQTEPGVIKRDIGGSTFRTPSTATLVLVEHTDPYHWKAELSFMGSTPAVVRELVVNLQEIGFKFAPPTGDAELSCPNGGTIRSDGSGDCKVNGYLPGGDGSVSVTIARPAAEAPGAITILRLFDHRTHGDEIGPPYPPDDD